MTYLFLRLTLLLGCRGRQPFECLRMLQASKLKSQGQLFYAQPPNCCSGIINSCPSSELGPPSPSNSCLMNVASLSSYSSVLGQALAALFDSCTRMQVQNALRPVAFTTAQSTNLSFQLRFFASSKGIRLARSASRLVRLIITLSDRHPLQQHLKVIEPANIRHLQSRFDKSSALEQQFATSDLAGQIALRVVFASLAAGERSVVLPVGPLSARPGFGSLRTTTGSLVSASLSRDRATKAEVAPTDPLSVQVALSQSKYVQTQLNRLMGCLIESQVDPAPHKTTFHQHCSRTLQQLLSLGVNYLQLPYLLLLLHVFWEFLLRKKVIALSLYNWTDFLFHQQRLYRLKVSFAMEKRQHPFSDFSSHENFPLCVRHRSGNPLVFLSAKQFGLVSGELVPQPGVQLFPYFVQRIPAGKPHDRLNLLLDCPLPKLRRLFPSARQAQPLLPGYEVLRYCKPKRQSIFIRLPESLGQVFPRPVDLDWNRLSHHPQDKPFHPLVVLLDQPLLILLPVRNRGLLLLAITFLPVEAVHYFIESHPPSLVVIVLTSDNHQGLKSRFTYTSQTSRLPSNCFMLGLPHPPKGVKLVREGFLSQVAYHRSQAVKQGQLALLLNRVDHASTDENIPVGLPELLAWATSSFAYQQLLLVSQWYHWHPSINPGLFSIRTHILSYRLLFTLLSTSFTCVVAFILRQEYIQIQVLKPSSFAHVRY